MHCAGSSPAIAPKQARQRKREFNNKAGDNTTSWGTR
jgi:hypothetical protein